MPEPTYTKAPVKMRYEAVGANAPQALEKVLNKQQGVEDVKVDPDTRTATFTYTGPVRNVKNIEAVASKVVPANLLNPAPVEFDAKGNSKAKMADLETRIGAMVGSVVVASGSRLEIMANLETTDWADFFAAAADTGYTLKPKSHTFMTYELSKGDDTAGLTNDIAKLGGVLVVKSATDAKKVSLIGDARTDLAGIAKLMKAGGFEVSKATLSW